MARKRLHIVPSGDEWVVKEDGRRLSIHPTQAEAETAARNAASHSRVELVVHDRDGGIEWKELTKNRGSRRSPQER
jgi:hypothetical protein